MNFDITDILLYTLYFLGYSFLCWFTPALIDYFNNVSKLSLNGSTSLMSSFKSLYSKEAHEPYNSYKKRMKKLEPDRSYYTLWTSLIIILLIFNSFILAEFFNNFGNLSSQLPLNLPIRLQYSHLIAAVIVFIEVYCGTVYYRSHQKQEENPDQSTWAMIKYFAILGFFFLMFVEGIMWSTISIDLNMSDALKVSANNVFKNYIDYFLAFLAISITLFEFAVGYQQSSCKDSKGESAILNVGKYILYIVGLSIMLFIPSILLIILYGLLIVLIQILIFFVLPGQFVYEKIFNKASTTK